MLLLVVKAILDVNWIFNWNTVNVKVIIEYFKNLVLG